MKNLILLLVTSTSLLSHASTVCIVTGLADKVMKFEFSKNKMLDNYENGVAGETYGMFMTFREDQYESGYIALWHSGSNTETQKIVLKSNNRSFDAQGLVLGNKKIDILCFP